MTALDLFRYGGIDFSEKFRNAIKQLNPHYRSPVRHLFSLDGLGRAPKYEVNLENDDDDAAL